MNKKADISGRMILWVYRLIFLTIVFFIINLMFTSYISRSVNTNDVETNILIARLLYGDKCIVYNDGIRSYPGFIDISKINEQGLNNCFNFEGKNIQGFNLVLEDKNGAILNSIIVNEDVYVQKVACNIKKRKVSCNNYREYVVYYKDKEFFDGILKVDVVTIDEQKR